MMAHGFKRRIGILMSLVLLAGTVMVQPSAAAGTKAEGKDP